MLYLGVLFLLILTYLRPQEFITIIQGWPIVFWTMVVLALPWLATLSYRKLLRTRIDLFMFLLWLIAVISWWNYWKSHMHSPAKEFGRVLLIYLFVAHAIDSRAKLTGVVWMTLLGLLIVGMMGGRDVGLKDQYASIGLFNNRNQGRPFCKDHWGRGLYCGHRSNHYERLPRWATRNDYCRRCGILRLG